MNDDKSEADRPATIETEDVVVTAAMAREGAYALFPDAVIDQTADELEVMTRVFRAMVTGCDPRLPSSDDLYRLFGKRE